MRKSFDGFNRDDLLEFCREINSRSEEDERPIGPVADPSFKNEGDLILRYRRPRHLGPMDEAELVESLAEQDGDFSTLNRISRKELAERHARREKKARGRHWYTGF